MRRPLVFLCGPAYQKDNPDDRRNILKRYINKEWRRNIENDYVHAIPVIVDDFFKPEEVRKAGLSIQINIIEEIISNIAYKTYIFLDTMSTSYELGQFTNFAYNTENVSVFVDKQYKTRNNNFIGEYIQDSFANKFIEYDAVYNNRGHIFFPYKIKGNKIKRQIPSSLIVKLNNDNPALINDTFTYKINFVEDRKLLNSSGVILAEKNDNELVFSFSQKNLFYYVTSVYTNLRKKTLKDFPKSIDDEKFISFKSELRKELLTSYVSWSKNKTNNSYILSNNFSMLIRCGNLDSDLLIYHMLYISFMMKDYDSSSSYLIRGEDFFSIALEGVAFPDSEIDMLSVLNRNFVNRLSSFKDEKIKTAIVKRTIKTRNKKRHIVAYSDNYSGRQLRSLHENILDSFLNMLPSSDFSYAYKKNRNTLMCLKAHEGNSYFVKLDIHKYFESISMSKMSCKISEFIQMRYSTLFNKITYFNRVKSKIFSDSLYIVRRLFCDYKLPIGFVTSPKISDFYLYNLDEDMSSIKGVRYTRYADDILISSNNKKKLNESIYHLKCLLDKEGLELNTKKTRFGTICNIGDSFKFLGINLVKRDGHYEYTVSHRYLIETSKLIFEFIKHKTDKNKEVVIGRINYIKSISQQTFEKLKKIIAIKLDESDLSLPYSLSAYF